MSGPVTSRDAAPVEGSGGTSASTVEVISSREAQVGEFRVRRSLPRRGRRTVGPWCFVDHMGPADVSASRGLGVGPHPHIGLHTVTWLLTGEALHRDSLGSEQVLRPGELNLMTAGRGVAHSEEGTGQYAGAVEGVQLWLAQPSGTRNGPPAFEHHAELPRSELGGATATVLVGELADAVSPARRDVPTIGVDLSWTSAGTITVPVDPTFEHALVVLHGDVDVDGVAVRAGELGYLGAGRSELEARVSQRARALLVGGLPFDEPVLMWWNYVARTRDELADAHRSWASDDGRFGPVASALERVDVTPPPWVVGD